MEACTQPRALTLREQWCFGGSPASAARVARFGASLAPLSALAPTMGQLDTPQHQRRLGRQFVQSLKLYGLPTHPPSLLRGGCASRSRRWCRALVTCRCGMCGRWQGVALRGLALELEGWANGSRVTPGILSDVCALVETLNGVLGFVNPGVRAGN